jgi:cysteine desulfurase
MPAPHIYLDHNSTTPIDPRVLEAMTRAWRDCGANPASQHAPGRQARRMIEEAREGILTLLGAKTSGMDADQLIFTSGGTEANNLAITGFAYPSLDCDVIVSPFEHPSILQVVEALRSQQSNVFVLGWNERFWRQLEAIEGHESVLVVSFMLANNETGVIFPMQDIVQTCGPYGAHVHTDAVQAIGKIPVNFRDLGVDAMTVAPHKFHGPLGIGALVVRHGVKLQPQLIGGFQQGGLRPGTENVGLAVGFHVALKLAVDELPQRSERMRTLRDEMERSLRAAFPDPGELVIIGEDAPRLPNTSNVSFPGVNRQALVMALDLAGVACSTGSACASGSSEPSPTLLAMGLPKDVIEGSIRLSLGAFTTAEEIAEAARRIIKAVKHLRSAK